jgi:hypothetical protein
VYTIARKGHSTHVQINEAPNDISLCPLLAVGNTYTDMGMLVRC